MIRVKIVGTASSRWSARGLRRLVRQCPRATAGLQTSDRILTVPNVITLVRLACLPVFLWLLFGEDNRAAAAALLAVLGATDWVDGYIARHFHQVSKLGKVLDPIADRLLFFVGVGGDPHRRLGARLVLRSSCSSARCSSAAPTARAGRCWAPRIDVTWFGKAGTFCLMFAFPLFLGLGASTLGWRRCVGVLAWVAGIPGLVLSYYAAVALHADRACEARASGAEPPRADATAG